MFKINVSKKFFASLVLVGVILLVLLVLLCFIISKKGKKEGFVSGLKQLYRPYIRSTRLVYEKNFQKIKNYWNVYLKKWGFL